RSPVGDGVELRRGAFIAAGVKQRSPERLADRGLLRLEITGFAQRHDRRLIVAVVEQRTAALVEGVHALHASILTAPFSGLREGARRRRGSPRRSAPWRRGARAVRRRVGRRRGGRRP